LNKLDIIDIKELFFLYRILDLEIQINKTRQLAKQISEIFPILISRINYQVNLIDVSSSSEDIKINLKLNKIIFLLSLVIKLYPDELLRDAICKSNAIDDIINKLMTLITKYQSNRKLNENMIDILRKVCYNTKMNLKYVNCIQIISSMNDKFIYN
jgi:hypothetical protein